MEKRACSAVMLDGITFRLGDNVETIKGANYWGEIIAFDTDDALPGCTVLATDLGFAGTKHVYPLKQLQHRTVSENPHAHRITELLEANNRYQQEARDARADLRRAQDQIEQLRASDAKWGQLHQKVIEDRAEALRENERLLTQLATLEASRPATPPAEQHADDTAVDRFAEAMKAKLAKKRDEGRGGWDGPTCSAEILSDLLRQHVEKGDPLDVGNLAMMLHQRGERIV